MTCLEKYILDSIYNIDIHVQHIYVLIDLMDVYLRYVAYDIYCIYILNSCKHRTPAELNKNSAKSQLIPLTVRINACVLSH
jgi:hypothetical protein